MIEKLDELNRLLLAATKIKSADGKVFEGPLLDACRSSVIEGRLPDHEQTLQFSVEIGFVSREGEVLRVTPAGETFLELNPSSVYELDDAQRTLLARTCYLGHPFDRLCRAVLQMFAPSATHGTLRWSSTEGPELPGPAWVVSHLCDLGLLVRIEDGLEVPKDVLPTVSEFVEQPQGLTEKKLQEILQEKLAVGGFAERMVFDFERARLSAAGHSVEAACVRTISKVRVNAGYDIESFDGASAQMKYDRMIEVKGSGGSSVRFIWSENEQKVAKQLGKKYWIYFQGGIDKKAGGSSYEPVLFQDPARTLAADTRLTTTPHGLLVEGKFKGKRKP